MKKFRTHPFTCIIAISKPYNFNTTRYQHPDTPFSKDAPRVIQRNRIIREASASQTRRCSPQLVFISVPEYSDAQSEQQARGSCYRPFRHMTACIQHRHLPNLNCANTLRCDIARRRGRPPVKCFQLAMPTLWRCVITGVFPTSRRWLRLPASCHGRRLALSVRSKAGACLYIAVRR